LGKARYGILPQVLPNLESYVDKEIRNIVIYEAPVFSGKGINNF
jgi:hypothetical protein